MNKQEHVYFADAISKKAKSEIDAIMRGEKPFVEPFNRERLEGTIDMPKHTPLTQQVNTYARVKLGGQDYHEDMRSFNVVQEHLVQQLISAVESEHFRQLCIALGGDRITGEQIDVVERVVRQLMATKCYHWQQEIAKLNVKIAIYERYLNGIKGGAMIDGVENPKYLAELAFRETEMELSGL